MRPLAYIALALCACSLGLPQAHPPCTTDAQCASGQICFPDGCGDPGSGLAVEIAGATTQGLNPQDFVLGDGGLQAVQNFSFAEPMKLSGHIELGLMKPTPYTLPTSINLSGQSTVIPGLVRNYQASFVGTDQGTYSMSVGSGSFTARVAATDTSVPPIRETGIAVNAGDSPSLDFQFAAPSSAVVLSGRLIKRTEMTVPPTQINLTAMQQAMDITAFDPDSQQPLSQVTHVSSGFPSSTGDFTIYIDPSAKRLTAINLLATPHDSTALMASKNFTLQNSGNQASPYPNGDQLVLEMGDFGDPIPQLFIPDGGGTQTLPKVLTSNGAPVPNALVSMQGPVAANGTFSSTTVTTDKLGQFSIASLPSDPQASFTLTVIPPTDSPAGITKRQVKVSVANGQGVISPGDVSCDDKVTVSGRLLRPDGNTPATGVLVTAVPISALPEDPNQPLPKSVMQTNTDSKGNFQLQLDPRVWRFDFTPGEALPLLSVVKTVKRDDSNTPVTFEPLSLRSGRQVTGHVSLPASQGGGPAQFATVRFFHVDTVEQQPSSLLLGEAVCDEQGNYTVVLPTANQKVPAAQ